MRTMGMKILGLLLLSSLGACCIEPVGGRYVADGPACVSYVDTAIGVACGLSYSRGSSVHVYRASGPAPAPVCRAPAPAPGPCPRPPVSHGGGHGNGNGNGNGHSQGSHSQGSHSQGSRGNHR